MTRGAQPRHPDPAGWVAGLFARQLRGEIYHLRVWIDVSQIMCGGVRVAVEVTFSDADLVQRDLLALVWPADVPAIAAAMQDGAEALIDRELRASLGGGR